MQREFSEAQPELMDLPNLDEAALRSDLQHLERLNRTFGGRKAVETIFHKLADKSRPLVLVDLASGYGDHGRNLIQRAQARLRDKASAVRRPDDRAADRHDPQRIFHRQNPVIHGGQQSLVAVDEAEHFPAQRMRRRDRGADDRVESGTIPATG